MTRKLLDSIEITTAQQCEYSVIWLHGLGASGHDFEPVVPELHLLQRPGVRFIFPHAPVRPIAINGGAAMRAWYDVTSTNFEDRDQDDAGIQDSADAVADLIEHEISRGVPASQIVLAGFSQGGAIALHAGLTGPHQLGGILALSTYLPSSSEALGALDAQRKATPLFMAHGEQDNVILISHGERSKELLEANGLTPEWKIYAMPHSVSGQEVTDISVWLKRLFGM
jgi:phospholipase/carboxylesterase